MRNTTQNIVRTETNGIVKKNVFIFKRLNVNKSAVRDRRGRFDVVYKSILDDDHRTTAAHWVSDGK